MPPRTIDQVIARLEEIIEASIAAADRRGYFAALYNRVTQRVKTGIANGEFDDGERMERLDVTFATRYLDAYDAYVAGELPSRAWLKAFEAARDPSLIVLQHLLLGMNAHINLDLGVAAARTCPGSLLPPLRADFDRINQVLASLTPTVEQEIAEESPDMGIIERAAPKLELALIGFAMDGAREAAWKFASELAPLPRAEQLGHMARRDDEVALLAAPLAVDGIVVRLIHARESTDVAENIRILATGEFRSTVPPTLELPTAAS
jgi:hypothetical protein